MKKAHVYKTIENLKRAIERCPSAKLVGVKWDQYYVADGDEYKFLKYFHITPKSTHKAYSGNYRWARCIGWRVSLEVGAILRANKQMINDITKYL